MTAKCRVVSVIPVGGNQNIGREVEGLLLVNSYALVMQLLLHNSLGYATVLDMDSIENLQLYNG